MRYGRRCDSDQQMRIYTDFEGNQIRLSDERLYGHIISEHPGILRVRNAIPQTLSDPDLVLNDRDDDEVRLYYKRFGRMLCVVVAVAFKTEDAFVITSYTTRRIPRA